MRDFLKSIDERVWLNITRGWKLSITIVDGIEILKNMENWTRDEINEYNWNIKGLM